MIRDPASFQIRLDTIAWLVREKLISRVREAAGQPDAALDFRDAVSEIDSA